MSYSSQRVTSDGTLVTLPISIKYLDRSEISVLFNGIVTVTGWSWVGTAEKTLNFSPAVPSGTEVTVLRTSDLSKVRHIFSLGAAFKATTIDEDFQQVLNIAQEARENATITDMYQPLNMHGYKISNVADGTDPLDAVNRNQLTENNIVVAGYANDASVSAEEARLSAVAAEASEQLALVWANEAQASVPFAIREAPASTPAAEDVLGFVDVSAPNQPLQKITIADLQASIGAYQEATSQEMIDGVELGLRSMSPKLVRDARPALFDPSNINTMNGTTPISVSEGNLRSIVTKFRELHNSALLSGTSCVIPNPEAGYGAYNNLKLVFSGVSTNGTSSLALRINGITTGYAGAVTHVGGSGIACTAGAATHIQLQPVAVAANAYNGVVEFSRVWGVSGSTWVITGTLTTTTALSYTASIVYALAVDAIATIEFTTLTGVNTLDGGTATLYVK